MKNSVEIIVEKAGDNRNDSMNKDFADVMRQYYDYQKVKRNYYRLGGLGFCLLSILIIVVILQTAEESDVRAPSLTNHHQVVSEPGMGPPPNSIHAFPEIVPLGPSAKKDMSPTTDRKSIEKTKQDSTATKPKEDLLAYQNLDSGMKQTSPAEPVAGFQNLYKYFYLNLTYPKELLADSVEGVVKVAFTINADSSISNLQVLQSLGLELDQEAIRLVESMPEWRPAVENGITTSSSFIIPIRFNIKENE